MEVPLNAQVMIDGSFYKLAKRKAWWWLNGEWRLSAKTYDEVLEVLNKCMYNGWYMQETDKEVYIDRTDDELFNAHGVRDEI